MVRLHSITYPITLAMVFAGVALSVASCDHKRVANTTAERERPGISKATAELLQEASQTFCFRGKPIHPALIREFVPLLSDRTPTTIALDLIAGNESNRYYDVAVERTGSALRCKVSKFAGASESNEWFEYEHLGKTADGTHVLRTALSGEGSGVFEDLVLIQLDVNTALGSDGKSYERLLIKSVGQFPLGDRDDGPVTVLPDKIIIGKSKYRPTPVTLEKWPDGSD